MEAASEVAKKYEDVAFVWISNSKPTEDELKNAEGYGLKDRFILITSDQIGEEHIDLFKLLRMADGFALGLNFFWA